MADQIQEHGEPSHEADPYAPVIIVTHGIGAAKLAANVLVPTGMLYRNGFNVLSYDMSNHGNSPKYNGRRTTVGIKEYLDVLGAWDNLVTRRGYNSQEIGLFGLSLGGASTLNAFAAEPRVACALVESPFSNLQHFSIIISAFALIMFELPPLSFGDFLCNVDG